MPEEEPVRSRLSSEGVRPKGTGPRAPRVLAAENYPTYPDLADRVAVVTGGSGGIGAATCRLLARNGAKVTVGGRDEAAINSVVKEIQSSGANLPSKQFGD